MLLQLLPIAAAEAAEAVDILSEPRTRGGGGGYPRWFRRCASTSLRKETLSKEQKKQKKQKQTQRRKGAKAHYLGSTLHFRCRKQPPQPEREREREGKYQGKVPLESFDTHAQTHTQRGHTKQQRKRENGRQRRRGEKKRKQKRRGHEAKGKRSAQQS